MVRVIELMIDSCWLVKNISKYYLYSIHLMKFPGLVNKNYLIYKYKALHILNKYMQYSLVYIYFFNHKIFYKYFMIMTIYTNMLTYSKNKIA